VQKRIIVNSSAIETRVALVEGGALAELHLESGGEHSIVGHVFKGKVLRVLPGMQAAFVDIGLEKAAFMHVSDFWKAGPDDRTGTEPDDDGSAADEEHGHTPRSESLAAYVEEGEVSEAGVPRGAAEAALAELEEDETAPMAPTDAEADPDAPEMAGSETDTTAEAHAKASDAPPPPPIEEVLSKGQEILVQVSKEPIGTKGARITSHISLPGRFVVYTPTTDHIGVSRRIENEEERKRLREIVAAGRGKSGGYIVRTACEGVSKREILADMRFLGRLWRNILKKNAASPAPALLHEDLDIVLRSIRDLFTGDVEKVVVDRLSDHQRIIEFIDGVLQPKLKSRVELYNRAEPIFDAFSLESHVQRALERRVWLKSGGYLVFDQTEALTTIDVNTGRFVGKRTHEETVLKTNLEAARIAIDQLRLRNIGGIIIIDFIDMEKPANRKKVSEALAEAVKRDKARTNVLRISELGLVQMTRKRTRDNLRQLITSPCPTCSGDGRLRSIESLAAQVIRDARRRAATAGTASSMRVRVSLELAEALRGRFLNGVRELGDTLELEIDVAPDRNLARGQWEIEILSIEPEPAADGS